MPKETKWICPECGGELYKDQHTGQGAKTCKGCGVVWFILKLKKEKNKEEKGEI